MSKPASSKTAVVYVHGLWMTGLEGGLLRCRLARLMHVRVPRFRYGSVGSTLTENALRLAEFLTHVDVETLHLVGHSLGGLVILRMFEVARVRELPLGRIVLMGSPVAGSRAAMQLSRWRIGRIVAGRSLAEGLFHQVDRSWNSDRDLGVIAGTTRVGLGRLVTFEKGASDGTVYLDETRIRGMKEHLTMSVTHTGMPFSARVTSAVARFLKRGSFAES